MSTNHGMDENDLIEIVMNNRETHETAIMHARSNMDGVNNPADSWEICKMTGEDIRDYVIRPSMERDHNIGNQDKTLTECLVSRMLGCVDWAEVGRHYIGEAEE